MRLGFGEGIGNPLAISLSWGTVRKASRLSTAKWGGLCQARPCSTKSNTAWVCSFISCTSALDLRPRCIAAILFTAFVCSNSSSSITRGYKTGYNIIETAGAAVGNGGVGGNGANGGNGGSSQGGGGGGSGYASGVTIVSSQLGGNPFNEPRVILRLV